MSAASLDPTLDTLAARLALLEARANRSERRLRAAGCLALLGAGAAFALGYQAKTVARRVALMEKKTAAISTLTDPETSQPTVRFTGVNVQIVNGLGSTSGRDVSRLAYDVTNEVNGRGNLIIGYNERSAIVKPCDETKPCVEATNLRTGSHNLIIGINNSYSSYGGLVVGVGNDISGTSATVTGGTNNIARGDCSTVAGGMSNTAEGEYATVSGGSRGSAYGCASLVAGGSNNWADGYGTSTFGGTYNRTTGPCAAVFGGTENEARGGTSSTHGGNGNVVSGLLSTQIGNRGQK